MQPPTLNNADEQPPSTEVGAGTFVFFDSDGYMLLITDRSVIACLVSQWSRIQPLVGVAAASDIPDLFSRVGLIVPPEAIAEKSSCEEFLRRQRRIVIPLDAILRVRLNADNLGAAITWRSGSRRRTRSVRLPPLEPVNDFHARLEFICRIMSAGGRDPATAWRTRREPMHWVRRAGPPAIALLVLVPWSTFLAFDLQNLFYEAPPDARRVQLLADVSRWTPTDIGLVVVAIIAIACCGWLVLRLKRPMLETVIERTDVGA